jgi:hypothetical protein
VLDLDRAHEFKHGAHTLAVGVQRNVRSWSFSRAA